MTSLALNPSTGAPSNLDGYDWRLAALFMLRVAGLPIDRAEDLRFPQTLQWTGAVLAAERITTELKDAVADVLEVAVGRSTDDQVRRQLINVRRAVFNLRPIRDLNLVADLLDGPGADLLRRFVAHRQRYVELLGGGEAVFGAEQADRRARLREVCQEPDLRLGMLLSSPSLDQYAEGYLTPPANPGKPAKLSKRHRRVERSLLEYLFRTACKTSPFSTLTAVSVGTFGEFEQPVDVRQAAPGKRSATRLNMAILARVSAIVLADPQLRADLPVRVTGSWSEDDDLVRYLRRSHQSMEDEEDSAAKVDPLHETLFFLPTGQVLGDVLRLASGDRPITVRQLELRLADVTGRDLLDVRRYVGHLLRLGLLELPDLQIDIHDADPLISYRDRLIGFHQPWADAIADRLTRMGAAVAEFGTAGLPRRRQLLDDVRAEVVAGHADLGRSGSTPPATLIYEDTALRTAVGADTGTWEALFLPDLRDLSRIMPAFDTSILRRVVTRGYFHIRHGAGGRCEDFLSFAHEFHRDFFDNFSQRLMRHQRFAADGSFVPHDNWLRQDELTAVDRAREVASAGLAEAYAALPAGATELNLDAGFVERVADTLPADLGALQPRSFFMQIADDGEHRPTAVVNRVYSGLTLLFSRFAHLYADEDLAHGLRGVLHGVQPPGAVFAELKGGYDATNLNLHPAVTPYEIVCPGETSFRPAGEQIPVDDLIVEEDLTRDRLVLRSKRLGLEVIPVYLGFLMPGALPEVQQVLLNFSYTGMAQLDLWSGVPAPAGGDVVMRPRIRYGNVVVARQHWKVAADSIPRLQPGQLESDWFLDWQRWRHANGIPSRVFLTSERAATAAPAPADSAEPADTIEPVEDKPKGPQTRPEHKPLYVDFDSYFCLMLVDTVARGGPGTLVLTEMLPGPEQLWLRDGAERYVTELTVEIDGVRRETP